MGDRRGLQEHRDEVDLELVEQAGAQVLLRDARPTADSMPSVTNVKVVSPRLATGSRG